jgi:hypothetical protein
LGISGGRVASIAEKEVIAICGRHFELTTSLGWKGGDDASGESRVEDGALMQREECPTRDFIFGENIAVAVNDGKRMGQGAQRKLREDFGWKAKTCAQQEGSALRLKAVRSLHKSVGGVMPAVLEKGVFILLRSEIRQIADRTWGELLTEGFKKLCMKFQSDRGDLIELAKTRVIDAEENDIRVRRQLARRVPHPEVVEL